MRNTRRNDSPLSSPWLETFILRRGTREERRTKAGELLRLTDPRPWLFRLHAFCHEFFRARNYSALNVSLIVEIIVSRCSSLGMFASFIYACNRYFNGWLFFSIFNLYYEEVISLSILILLVSRIISSTLFIYHFIFPLLRLDQVRR